VSIATPLSIAGLSIDVLSIPSGGLLFTISNLTITNRGGLILRRGGTDTQRRVAAYAVVEGDGEAATGETRYSVAPDRPFGPLITPPPTRYSGITVPPISMYRMKIPPNWIRNLRWYALMASTFGLAWAWAWSIDVVLQSLLVAVLLQWLALLLDRS
jgi:hypothetical protein